MSASQLNLKALSCAEAVRGMLGAGVKAFGGRSGLQVQIQSGAGNFNFTSSVASASEHPELTAFLAWASARSYVMCSLVDIRDPQRGDYLRYASQDGLFATIEIGSSSDPRAAMEWTVALEASFAFLSCGSLVNATGLNAPERAALLAREQSVVDLKAQTEKLGIYLADMTVRETEARRARQAELEAVFRDKSASLEAERAQMHAAAEERQRAFDARVAEYETRDSKHVRRNLLKKLDEALAELKNPDTAKAIVEMRRPFRNAIFAMCFVFTFVAGYMGYQYANTRDLHFLIPSSGGLLGLTGTLLYYAKWSDRWFREHADAEHLARRYKADMVRASWLAELVSEWAAEGHAPLESLLETLSKNLFTRDGGEPTVDHPLESILNVLRKGQKLDIGKDHVSVESGAKS